MGSPILPGSVYAQSLVGALPFNVALTTSSSTAKAIVPGIYELVSDVDCYVTVDTTSGVVAAAPASSQPGSPGSSRTRRVPPGCPIPFAIESWAGSTPFLAAIALAGSGTLTVNGPLRLEVPGT